MKIQDVDKIFFFTGAASWIPDAILYAESKGIACHVFAVKRHLDEIFDTTTGVTFKEVLEEKNISWFHSDDINTSEEFKKLATKNSIGIGLGEAYTFNTETLECLDRKVFDFMTIRMPKYRGGAHFTWQILQQSRIGAWYVQVVNEEMIPGGYDTGEILKAYEYIIPQSARIPADYFKVADEEGLNMFKAFVGDVQNGHSFQLTKLQENLSLYLPRLYTMRHAYIDWSWTGEEIERFICAFDSPYVGATTFCNGAKILIKSAQFERGEGAFHPFVSGIIYRIHNNVLFVAVKNGTIIVEIANNEEGKLINDQLKPGFRLFTPSKYIEDAMMFNAEFTATGLK